MERIEAIEQQLEDSAAAERFTDVEREAMASERQDLAEEAIGYELVEEVLEHQRELIAAGRDSRAWVAGMPEIVANQLARVQAPSGETAYLMARLTECVAYPAFDSPEVRGRFDLLRRQLLAKSGNVREALMSPIPSDSARECVGQIKLLAHANGIPIERMSEVLEEGFTAELSAPGPVLLPSARGDR